MASFIGWTVMRSSTLSDRWMVCSLAPMSAINGQRAIKSIEDKRLIGISTCLKGWTIRPRCIDVLSLLWSLIFSCWWGMMMSVSVTPFDVASQVQWLLIDRLGLESLGFSSSISCVQDSERKLVIRSTLEPMTSTTKASLASWSMAGVSRNKNAFTQAVSLLLISWPRSIKPGFFRKRCRSISNTSWDERSSGSMKGKFSLMSIKEMEAE